MNDAAAVQDQADGAGPLGRALGLNAQEVTVLGEIFTETTRTMGIDGGPIFEKLKAGESLGRALGLPPGVRNLLYARAHRWFTFGRADRAEPLFRALCIMDERNADHWVGYGVCLRLRQNPAHAAIAFATAARLRPDWAVPHFHALELALHSGQWAQAKAHLDRYDACDQTGIADAIKSEVQRLRAAVALRLPGSGA